MCNRNTCLLYPLINFYLRGPSPQQRCFFFVFFQGLFIVFLVFLPIHNRGCKIGFHVNRPTNVEISSTFLVFNQICRRLLFNNFSFLWTIKILLMPSCECTQMLSARFSACWWNCLEGVCKSRFLTFCEFVKKMVGGNGRGLYPTYITRLSTIHLTRIYKVFKCATKYMGVISQNALPLIIVPPSGGNSGWQ